MQKQITRLMRWVEIDGNEGLVYVPFDTVFPSQNKKTAVPSLAELQPFYSGEISEMNIVDGYGARFSSPGYLDCTEWVFGETEEEALKVLKETFPDV